jgi:hypothetical protein
MSIVDNNDDLWKSMAKDKLTDDEVLKSNFLDDRKANRKTFFGFASATTASTTLASSSSSSSFSTNSNAYNDARLYDNKPFGSKGVAFEYSSGSSSSIGLSSLDHPPDRIDDNVGDDEGEDDKDEDTTPTTSMKIISLPENIKLITGEEDDDSLLQMRAKLYRLNTHSTDSAITTTTTTTYPVDQSSAIDINTAEWIEVGVGPLKILQHKTGYSSRSSS